MMPSCNAAATAINESTTRRWMDVSRSNNKDVWGHHVRGGWRHFIIYRKFRFSRKITHYEKNIWKNIQFWDFPKYRKPISFWDLENFFEQIPHFETEENKKKYPILRLRKRKSKKYPILRLSKKIERYTFWFFRKITHYDN